MALHPDFPESPYAILDPVRRSIPPEFANDRAKPACMPFRE